jgi:parallel beta-helix repeat protein
LVQERGIVSRRLFFGIIGVLMLVGMLNLPFESPLVKAIHLSQYQKTMDGSVLTVPQNRVEKLETSYVANQEDFCWTLARGRWPLEAEEEVPSNLSFIGTAQWRDTSCIQGNAVELVVGINESESNYHELADCLLKNSGKLVDSFSIGEKTRFLVADVPLSTVNSFISEAKTAGLANCIGPNAKCTVDSVPNDPSWSLQWGPQKIGADWAWNITAGSHDILVAVVDTGIDYTHPDLAPNYVPTGYNWVADNSDPKDDFGHGTHVAGIVAAAINNSIGIAGLAQVRMMAEKVLDENGVGTTSEVAQGIVDAVDKGARIINLSLGSNVDSEVLHQAVIYAYDHGVLVVAAAGNDATNAKNYPAGYDEALSVSATDQSDNPAAFTNYGDWVDVATPGVEIYSTMPTYHVTLNNYGYSQDYDFLSGTSMACPHVVGVAALIWSQFPNMTRDEVRAQLQNSADDLGTLGIDVYYGHGRANARNALQWTPSEHDVLVSDLKVPSYLSLGKATIVNTTVLNMGTNQENVTVSLLVNGSLADSAVINSLTSGASAVTSFSWNATLEGIYNVTSFVMPVTGETITGNNALFKLVEVKTPRFIRVPTDYSRIQDAVDVAHEGDTVFVASGRYYENVRISTSGLTLIGENSNATVIDAKQLHDAILVTADDVTIDNFTLQHSGDWYGGLTLLSSTGSRINNLVISSDFFGILIELSSHATLRNNTLIGNEYNLGVDGDSVMDFIHDVDSSNTVDGKPVCYWVNESDKQVPLDAGYVAIVNSTNIIVKDVNLRGNYDGVLFANTADSMIENVFTSGNGFGIRMHYSKNNTIRSCIMLNNFDGLQVEESDNNTISVNTVSNCTGVGFVLQDSGFNTVTNNSLTANGYNFDVEGVNLNHFIQDIDTSNTVNGKPVYYLVGQHNVEIAANAGYLAVVNSTDITVAALDITDNSQGILFAYVTDSTISGNSVASNVDGIHLFKCSYDTICRNSVRNSHGDGIGLYSCDHIAIVKNTVTDATISIDIASSDDCATEGNILLGNTIGIYLLYSSHSFLNGNTVSPGTANGLAGIGLTSSIENVISGNMASNYVFLVGAGIYLEWSSNDNTIVQNTMENNNYGVSVGYWGLYGLKDQDENNSIYHNNFIDNNYQILSLNSINNWDNGYPSGGNYWNDYHARYPDARELDDSGRWNVSYVIDENNKDSYPLMRPWRLIPGDVNLDLEVDLRDLVLLAFAYGSNPGSTRWDPLADLAPPYGTIGLTDLVTVASYYGKTYP